jgi:type 1 glutamine amidotransferase
VFEREGKSESSGPTGRSFGTTLGHFHDNFANESFRRLIVNGILWSARIDVPPDGARGSRER